MRSYYVGALQNDPTGLVLIEDPLFTRLVEPATFKRLLQMASFEHREVRAGGRCMNSTASNFE